MRLLYAIILLGFLCFESLLFAAYGEPEFYVTEELMAKTKEFDTLLQHPSLKDLMASKLLKRPEKCPIENLTTSQLHTQLGLISKAFEYGECLNKNAHILKGLSLIAQKASLVMMARKNPENSFESLSKLSCITDLESDEIDGMTSTQDLAATRDSLIDASYYSNVTGYLAKISEDEDCMTNLRKQGFLSNLGNVITTMGQASLLIPSPSGFLFSTAGIAFGSTLKILSSMFKSPFDWSNADERAQFEELNCSFFKLRRDIEASHVLRANEKKSLEQVTAIKKQLLLIDAYKERLLAEQKKINLDVLTLKKNYYNSKNKLATYSLYQIITLYLARLDPEIKKIIPDQALIIRLTSEFLETLSITKGVESLKNYVLIKKLLEPFSIERVLETHALEYKIFFRQYLNPLLTYLIQNKKLLDKELLPPTKEFLDLRKHKSSRENKDIIKLVDTSYLTLLQRVGDTSIYLKKQVEILNSALKRKEFDSYDDGSHMDYNIIEKYLKIQESIYEKNGYSYVDFFKDSAYESYKQFEKDYNEFEKFRQTVSFKKDLPWICRAAKQTIIRWSFADSAAETIWDFMEANAGIFYPNVKKVKFFLHVLPVGRRKQYKLYQSARSAQIAKALYDQEKRERERKRLEKAKQETETEAQKNIEKKKEELKKKKRRLARKHMSKKEEKRDIKKSNKLKKELKIKKEKENKKQFLFRLAEGEYFQEESQQKLLYHRKELDPYGLRRKRNLGKLILEIKYAEELKEQLVSFRKENQCTRFD